MVHQVEEHIAAVKETYYSLVAGTGSRLIGGARLWRQFEGAVAAYRNHGPPQLSGLFERVNELAVAWQILTDDSLSDDAILYEPEILETGAKFDFVVTEVDGSTRYIEVKTVEPRTQGNDLNWKKIKERQKLITPNNRYLVDEDWMGARIFSNSFSARASFRTYTLETEAKLLEHNAVRPGRGVLVFCGTGFAWHLSELEDFADFYLTGGHRPDDPFAKMEQHNMQEGGTIPARTLERFVAMIRKHNDIVPSKWISPVQGPRL